MLTKAILFTGPNRVECTEVEVPSPGPGEILIETLYTVASPGTDLRCLMGTQPGNAPWPNIPGYSLVGRIIEGEGTGTLVFCGGTSKASVALQWGGHIGHAVVKANTAHPIPEGIDPKNAVCAHLAGIALRGVRLTRPTIFDTVAVIGLGPIGQLSARLFALSGARMVAVDVAPDRVEVVKRAGVRALVAEGDPSVAVRSVFPDGADIVVDATGSPNVIGLAGRAAKDKPWDDSPVPGPRVVIQGSYPDILPVPYQEAFMKEITYLTPRDCPPSEIRFVLGLMAEGRLKADEVISRMHSPEEAADGYASLVNREPGVLTVAFRWNG